MLADKSGYCLKFDVYTGKNNNKATKDLGAKVVTSLVKGLEEKEHKVYFDNYFTNVHFMKDLKEKGINACGTVKPSRKNLPTFISSKKINCGDSETLTSSTGIGATKWRDKNDVFILTNFHDPSEMSEVNRRQKDGSKCLYPCPICVTDYNKNMNSVDKFDQLMASYKLDRRSKKWWHRIFFYFLDAAVVNSYIVFRTLKNNMPLKEFKIHCVEGLLATRLVQRKRSATNESPLEIKKSKPTVPVEIRRKESSHQPKRSTRRRCALCSTKTKEVRTDWVCSVCEVPLCLGKKKECLQKYHA
ncbi:piggyBac transposable element-derived protein 4-like [Eriocheir sinensis]|uniref:piggyBac transposable element-derived protein 4-like n=1 Tax=Eriocheir sinensis TaxID=95602 RepID=UPI0021CA9C1D|nr:piggyBac transposable element-derived protein 4-like [Eriocheir sinensis]